MIAALRACSPLVARQARTDSTSWICLDVHYAQPSTNIQGGSHSELYLIVSKGSTCKAGSDELHLLLVVQEALKHLRAG